MVPEEKLEKASNHFSSLSAEKQDYVLGILEALVFANNLSKSGVTESTAQGGNAPKGA